MRLTALTVFLAVILVFMVALILKAVRPYREAGVESRGLAETRRQVSDYERRNAALQCQITYLKTADGIISAGHGMGYLRPGEIPLVIEGMPDLPADTVPTEAMPPSPDTAATGPASLAQRFWSHLGDL